MSAPAPAVRLSRDELRRLFLFTDLDDEQLDWVSGHGDVIDVEADTVIVAEGARARCFYVLLSGTLLMSKRVGADPVEITRTDQRGVYFGATQFYLGDQVDQTNTATVRAITASRFLALPNHEFEEVFRRWFPMAVHLLQGMFVGISNANALVGQRERLLALGKLTAGLTHELNNPAAAAGRAADALRDRVAGMRHKLAMLAEGGFDRAQLRALTGIQERFADCVRAAAPLTAVAATDLEDELGDWLDERGIGQGWELAAVFVAGGLRLPDLRDVADAVPPDRIENALRWLAYTVETENLLHEITERPLGSPPWWARRSSTPSWTGPPISGSTCTRGWRPPW